MLVADINKKVSSPSSLKGKYSIYPKVPQTFFVPLGKLSNQTFFVYHDPIEPPVLPSGQSNKGILCDSLEYLSLDVISFV